VPKSSAKDLRHRGFSVCYFFPFLPRCPIDFPAPNPNKTSPIKPNSSQTPNNDRQKQQTHHKTAHPKLPATTLMPFSSLPLNSKCSIKSLKSAARRATWYPAFGFSESPCPRRSGAITKYDWDRTSMLRCQTAEEPVKPWI
jgi:hypothetical protein